MFIIRAMVAYTKKSEQFSSIALTFWHENYSQRSAIHALHLFPFYLCTRWRTAPRGILCSTLSMCFPKTSQSACISWEMLLTSVHWLRERCLFYQNCWWNICTTPRNDPRATWYTKLDKVETKIRKFCTRTLSLKCPQSFQCLQCNALVPGK